MIANFLPILSASDLVASYRPFLDPLPVGEPWAWPWLVVPLCIAVAVVYKSIRCRSMKQVPREAGELVLWILIGMAGGAVALGLVVRGLEAMHR